MLLDQILTRSNTFAEVLRIVKRVAQTDANVLLSGETGSGKDYIAGVIHDAGSRRAKPFLKIDCASIPSALAESEFFGYEKGAFSDASQTKTGKLQMGDQGTIYLDGINHLPASVQSKLLRFVQERKLERLGSEQTHFVDCRLIASCSVPLKTCLKEKQIREDLYFRLASVVIDVPPLRERLQDLDLLVPALLKEFNEKYRKKTELDSECMNYLRNYPWPGNIRELRNVLEHAVIYADTTITPNALSRKISVTDHQYLSFASDQNLSLEDIERMYIAEVLNKVKGHQTKASRILGISRKTLLFKKRKYGLN